MVNRHSVGAFALFALTMSLAACDTNSRSPRVATPVRPTSESSAELAPGGCGKTEMYQGPSPEWAQAIARGGIPGGGAPSHFAIGRPPIAVVYPITLPLISGNATERFGRGNKVLWALKGVKAGQAVSLDAYRLGDAVPSVHYDLAPPTDTNYGGAWEGSGPNVPTPGCWTLIVSWGDARSAVDLTYVEKP